MQNGLEELWSLLNFLLPHVFDSTDAFMDWCVQRLSHLSMILLDAPIAAGLPLMCASRFGGAMRSSSIEEAHSEAALLSVEQTLLVTGRLHRVLRPFVLRRLKETVAAELAPKVQCTLRCRSHDTCPNACQRTEPMHCALVSPGEAGHLPSAKSKLGNAAICGRWSGS